ncbi:hypothetical protein WAI453_002928 [Rhynchosporium graminicola]|uniref:Uncharacterized protein n=1 Tax=Rhynchosporium graminicola TaxID=2792576 RepID=A0A1E1JVN7_9HELO|nr:uncharacterized protein RCO7_02350 [Rhynchosporium commune]
MNLPCSVKAVESAVGASKNEMVDVGIPKTAQEKKDEIEMARKNLKTQHLKDSRILRREQRKQEMRDAKATGGIIGEKRWEKVEKKHGKRLKAKIAAEQEKQAEKNTATSGTTR